MRVAERILCLLSREFTDCFTKPVPAALCPGPIVVLEGAFEREARMNGEERGKVPVTVLVVRESGEDAEAVAIACEQFIRHAEWEHDSGAWPWRIVGIDTTTPTFKERDASGRNVWQFVVTVTAVRSV